MNSPPHTAKLAHLPFETRVLLMLRTGNLRQSTAGRQEYRKRYNISPLLFHPVSEALLCRTRIY